VVRLLAALLIFGGLSSSGEIPKQDMIDCSGGNNTSASAKYRGSRGNAPPGHVSKLPIRTLLYPGAETRIYTRYMPWFGDPHHRDVGYRSDDAQQIARQVADMKSRGIQGAIVDWYGPRSGPKNDSTMQLMREAERQGFEFAISEDAGALSDCKQPGCDVTGHIISDLQYVADHFESSAAYVRFEGRPAVFFFGLENYAVDWRRVRQSIPLKPLFFFRNSGSFTDPNADGAYAWIAPETATSSDPMGLQYLQRFYSKAQTSSKIAVGSAYKGFDDAEAGWGKGRVINQQCGHTWLSTFAETSRFYSAKNQLRALMIPTWNDYEEGTEIETGVENCVQVQGRLTGDTLNWSISGPEDTVDHYAVLAKRGSEWIEAADVRPGIHSIALTELRSSGKPAAFCVEAVGKASILNHFSGPIENTRREEPDRASPNR
jgi:hypothetical protein